MNIEQPIKVKVDHGGDPGCLGVLIIIAAMLLGSAIEKAGNTVAEAIKSCTTQSVVGP